MKKLFVSVAAFAMLAAGVAHANEIELRKAMMKSNGESMGVLAKMAKGEMDYDAAAALDAFTKMNKVAMQFGAMFPAGTETGGETTANPKIWEDAAGWEAALKKYADDTAAAVAAAPADKEAFMPVFGAVAGNCQSCHQAFRVAKN
jgi:cytochrome c556